MVNAGSRPLPDFLIIGAQRCGTTSLYRYLEKHPQVIGAAPSKGVHYFDVHHERSLRWYRAHFPTRRRRDRAGDRAVTGEASPYYVFHPHGPDRVRAAVPNVRLILMLRDPVVRAFSQYQQEYARGFEDAETFEQALELEPGRLAGERERMLADPRLRQPRDAALRVRRPRASTRPSSKRGAPGSTPTSSWSSRPRSSSAIPRRPTAACSTSWDFAFRRGRRSSRRTTPGRPAAWRPRRARAWPSTSRSRTGASRSCSAGGWDGRPSMADEGIRAERESDLKTVARGGTLNFAGVGRERPPPVRARRRRDPGAHQERGRRVLRGGRPLHHPLEHLRAGRRHGPHPDDPAPARARPDRGHPPQHGGRDPARVRGRDRPRRAHVLPGRSAGGDLHEPPARRRGSGGDVHPGAGGVPAGLGGLHGVDRRDPRLRDDASQRARRPDREGRAPAHGRRRGRPRRRRRLRRRPGVGDPDRRGVRGHAGVARPADHEGRARAGRARRARPRPAPAGRSSGSSPRRAA